MKFVLLFVVLFVVAPVFAQAPVYDPVNGADRVTRSAFIRDAVTLIPKQFISLEIFNQDTLTLAFQVCRSWGDTVTMGFIPPLSKSEYFVLNSARNELFFTARVSVDSSGRYIVNQR